MENMEDMELEWAESIASFEQECKEKRVNIEKEFNAEEFLNYIIDLKKENAIIKRDLRDVQENIFPFIEQTIKKTIEDLITINSPIEDCNQELLCDIYQNLESVQQNYLYSRLDEFYREEN